jgi:hypothetical protein
MRLRIAIPTSTVQYPSGTTGDKYPVCNGTNGTNITKWGLCTLSMVDLSIKQGSHGNQGIRNVRD